MDGKPTNPGEVSSEEEPQRQVIYWPGLVPERWHKDLGVKALLVRVFRTGRIPSSAVEVPVKIVELDYVRAVLTTVGMSYLDNVVSRLEMRDDGKVWFATQPKQRVTDPGVHVALITPVRSDRPPPDALSASDRLKVIAGLLGATLGRNIQYDQVFECEVDLASNQTSFVGRSFLNPHVLPTPDVSNQSLLQVVAIHDALNRLSPEGRSRTVLSLRWFFEALHDQGVDAFLRHWVALETLVMETTHVGPINALLAQSYGITPREAVEWFAVGRLQGLRSEIVHHGRTGGFDGPLLDYVGLLYQDVLLAVLGLPSRRVALALAREVVPTLLERSRRSRRDPQT